MQSSKSHLLITSNTQLLIHYQVVRVVVFRRRRSQDPLSASRRQGAALAGGACDWLILRKRDSWG